MRTTTGRTAVRQRKLNPKAGQAILREDQIEEYDALQNPQGKHVTGVEEGELGELHLQAALAGQSNGGDDTNIPAPPAQAAVDFDYDSLYTLEFHQPYSYIAFSSTVEDCNGCQYDMTTEDDTFLRAYNNKKTGQSKCSENGFERIMEVFEKAAEIESPYANVDNTVLPLEKMLETLRELIAGDKNQDTTMRFAPDIYEYWKTRRQDSGNHPLQPSLKFEINQESDDGDPYVCFRRRDVRQTRKTRARDVQSTDRLRKLRKELDEGRQLVTMTLQREKIKSSLLLADSSIFVKRASVKDTKVRLNIKTDDDDLINQKPQKRRASDYPMVRPGTQPRLPGRTDGRSFDADLTPLSDINEEKENAERREVEEKSRQHRKWNEPFVDLTIVPLAAVRGSNSELTFRPVIYQRHDLPTPPSSLDSGSGPGHSLQVQQDKVEPFSFRSTSPPTDDEQIEKPAFRRRIGRGGRLWIDRTGLPSAAAGRIANGIDDGNSDRWKFDEDDSEEQPVYERDPYDTRSLRYRAAWIPPSGPQRGRQDERALMGSNRPVPVAQPHAPT